MRITAILRFWIGVLLITSLESLNAHAVPLKKVFFIGTGGTIAGIADSPSSPSYDPGRVTINAILSAVPDIRRLADINGQQLIDVLKVRQLIAGGLTEDEALKKPEAYVNTCSCSLTEYHWRLLEERVERALNDENYDAVIITHGTDTIEETAFFLEMTVNSTKPVILVGASRPANHPQADGPDNIRDAVRVAINSRAQNRGVMIVMNGKIVPAFNVVETKARPASTPIIDRFSAPHFGFLGRITHGWVFWDQNELIKKTFAP